MRAQKAINAYRTLDMQERQFVAAHLVANFVFFVDGVLYDSRDVSVAVNGRQIQFTINTDR